MLTVELWHWIVFSAYIAAAMGLNLVVSRRRRSEASLRESAVWTAFWCLLALGFNGLIWKWFGGKPAVQFFTGYLVEWMLSMDNVFVFAVIFSYFKVPMKYQHRVLFWGIMGAIVMRLAFILIGATIIKQFALVTVLLGIFLILTGIKLAWHSSEVDPEHSWILRLARACLRISREHHGEQFFTRENGRLCATPLFLVLIVIEGTDVVFAVDSVPAILGITQDTFLVFTSNLFAILGLRALYFLLAGVMDVFRYLKYGLSAILVFVGGKMTAEYLVSHEVGHEWLAKVGIEVSPDYLLEDAHFISPVTSLLVIVACLTIAIAASLIAARLDSKAPKIED